MRFCELGSRLGTREKPASDAAATSSATRGGFELGADGKFLSALFVVALLVRIAVVFRTDTIFNDGPQFLRLAEAMHRGQWLTALADDYHPLYPFLIHLAHSLFELVGIESWETAAVACSVLAGALAVVPLYLFIRAAFDVHAARIACLALAVHPYAARFAGGVQSDAPYLLLFLSAVACLYAATRSGRADLAFAVGILSGLSYLVRPEGIGVAVVACWLCATAVWRRRWRVANAVEWLASLGMGAGLCVAPYLAVIRLISGRWSVSQKKSIFVLLGFGESGGSSASEWSLWSIGLIAFGIAVALGASALAVRKRRRIADAYVQMLSDARTRARIAAGFSLAFVLGVGSIWPDELLEFGATLISTLRPELLLLVALGVAACMRNQPGERAAFLAPILILYAVVLFGLLLHYGYLTRRHALPPLVLVLGYAGVGVQVLSEGLRSAANRRRRRPDLSGWPTVRWSQLVVVLMVAIALPKTLNDFRAEERAARLAAEWVREQTPRNARIATVRSKLGYYANRDRVALVWRNGSLRSLGVLNWEKVRYLIAEERDVGNGLYPAASLRSLENPQLKEVFRVEAKGELATVFELARETFEGGR